MIRYIKGCLENPEKGVFISKKEIYNSTIFSFDIESTSAYKDGNRIFMYDKSKNFFGMKNGKLVSKSDYWNSFEKVNILYEWTLFIEDTGYYGRTIDEMECCFRELAKKFSGKLIIYVHNLSYEFMFLLNIFNFQKIFARNAHKIIYLENNKFVFRCTYMLTRLSLAKWGEKLGIPKMVGDLDYNIMRTPLTELTERELKYCEHDGKIIVYGIRDFLKRYKNLNDIPLTQTGEVRKVVKDIFANDMDYHKKMTRLLPYDWEEYEFMVKCFWGGSTFANCLYVNITVHDVISRDEKSAYPYVMAVEKYPQTPWMNVEANEKNYKKYNDGQHSLIVKARLNNLKSIYACCYLPTSKCYEKNGVQDNNGKVLSAKSLVVFCTNIDLDLIEKLYRIDKVEFLEIKISRNDYLDKRFVNYLLTLFSDKTELDGIEGQEAIYLQSKQFINSMFGMMVTKLMQREVLFDREEKWHLPSGWDDEKEFEKMINDKRNKMYKNYLSYSHGIFITAYARRNLWQQIIDGGLDKFIVYADTDCLKYLMKDYAGNLVNDSIFYKYNQSVREKICKVARERGLDEKRFMPISPKGVECCLGIFELEKNTPYREFRTMGAKRYFYVDSNGESHITVSGVNKVTGVNAVKKADDFREGLVFNEDDCKKAILTYLYDMPPVLWKSGEYDEYMSYQKYGIHMQETTYTLSLKSDFRELVRNAINRLF